MADFLDTITDEASNIWGSFDLNKFLETASQAYATIKKADQPATSVAQPGTLRRLPDGSLARVNADGSLTVTSTSGAQQTVGATASLIPGVSNVLLLGGVAVVGAFFLLQRKRR